MFKYIITLTCSIFIISACNHQDEKLFTESPVTDYKAVYIVPEGSKLNSLEKSNILGPVKEIKNYVDIVRDGNFESAKAQTLSESYLFDTKGYLKEKKVFDGEKKQIQMYSYDDDYVLTTNKISIIESDTGSHYQYINKFNDGRIFQTVSYDPDGISSTRTYTYDDINHTITSKLYINNDSLVTVHKDIYDKDDKIINTFITRKSYQATDKEIITYRYNDQGLMSEYITSHTIGSESKIYRYDDQNRIVTMVETLNGTNKSRTEYDLYYRPIHLYEYDYRDRVTAEYKYEYLYDSYGNWVEKRVYEKVPGIDNDFHPRKIIYRKYSYYESK